MTISSIDAYIAGAKAPRLFYKALSGTLVAGRPFSYWASTGIPGPGAFDNTLIGVALTASTNGQIPVPASGTIHLGIFSANCTQIGNAVLADRLWHNGNIAMSSTSSQTINSATWPARDDAQSTNGDGVLIGLEVSATTGAQTPASCTMTYTNSAGTGSRTAVTLETLVTSSLLGTFYRFALQAGDVGVRSIQSIQFAATAWTSGTVNLVAYRVLATAPIGTASVPSAMITLATGAGAQLTTASVPWLFVIPSTTTSSRLWGVTGFVSV